MASRPKVIPQVLSVTSASEPAIAELHRRVAELEEQLRTLRRTGEPAQEIIQLLTIVEPGLLRNLKLGKFVRSITDATSRLIAAQFGSFFYNVSNERGDALKEALSGFPMPCATELLAPTFRGEGVVRYADITVGARCEKASRNGNPKGQVAVKSFLAAPVVSQSGEILGGLFFGHSEPERFTPRHEALVTGVAAQAAIAIDNARLFEQAQWVQEELKHSNQDLRRANRDLETFAYSASHDLQEPLRNVAVNAQLLERAAGGKLSGDSSRFLQAILQGARRMETLVKDLQAYTYATKQADGTPPKLWADAVLAGVLENLARRIQESGATITWSDLPQLRMHEIHLTQILQNLIGNALKYRRPNEAPRVHVSASRDDAWWVLSVSDNGIGIAPEYADQIFELFKRLHSENEYPGSGVGLSICRRIVEQYGGRIWLEESVPGLGSTFRFSLPELFT